MMNMKKEPREFRLLSLTMLLVGISLFYGCDNGNDDPDPIGTTGMSEIYALSGTSGGTATFEKLEDGSTRITLDLASGGDAEHPAHIHDNTAAEGGGIAISLTSVGSDGESETIVTMKDDGTPITYEELIDYDGYINVHASADDLTTLVAQGDIGQNELTGESKAYALGAVANLEISGTATFHERANDETLVVLMLENTPDGGMHPAHIHANTAAEGGAIVIGLSDVDGTTGMSKTNVTMSDGGAITYTELLDFDGYINVHASAEDLATLVAQGDIGQNELTGESKGYALGSVADPEISGTATFYERANNETLIVLTLANTPAGGMHPAHIHANTAAEGGGILIGLSDVDGTTGMSKTNVNMSDGAAITYSELLDFDGYINVHASAEDLGTLVAQGDIGQNELTGTMMSYPLAEKDLAGVSGTANFYERANGETLVTLMLTGPVTGDHPAHIHSGSVAAPGGIAISLSAVNSAGMSKTNVSAKDDAAPITYTELLAMEGYINVHSSSTDLGTLIAQGNVGASAN